MPATNKVRDTVRLHPSTVTNYEQFLRKVYRPGTNAALRVIQVDMRVWRAAMKLAKGDSTRIVVHSVTEVVVVNQSKRK